MSWHGIPIPFTNRNDWLEKRRAGIGASDVAGIVGLSPYSSPYSVWADKTKGLEKEETRAMHMGRMLEDVVVAEFETETGLYVGVRELLVRHPDYEWVMATVDGVAFEHPIDGTWIEAAADAAEDRAVRDMLSRSLDYPGKVYTPAWTMAALGNVQLKTEALFGRWTRVPDHYETQVQWEMLATGLTQTWIPVLHGGRLSRSTS